MCKFKPELASNDNSDQKKKARHSLNANVPSTQSILLTICLILSISLKVTGWQHNKLGYYVKNTQRLAHTKQCVHGAEFTPVACNLYFPGLFSPHRKCVLNTEMNNADSALDVAILEGSIFLLKKIGWLSKKWQCSI